MVMLVIMIMGSAAFLVSSLSRSGLQTERDQKTADALAQAKEALIGYATSVQIDLSTCMASGNNCKRLGDLPCPDTTNDGSADSCGNASGSTGQTLRIGRLPWKTLGLPDLRDGSGEKLWYAVSNNFKNSTTRTTCTAPGQPGCLNSDTLGTISVFSSDGTILNDGGGSTGAVAVIIAPGDILQRQGGAIQDRSAAGINTASNYLDIATVGGITEDNASFTDGSSTNGFIQGRIKDSNGNIIVNDQLLVITQDNIMLPIQKRVAAEVRQCLNEYAAPANGGFGRYPWPAMLDPFNSPNYNDSHDYLFGRVPDFDFNSTKNDSGDQMSDIWPATCNINPVSGWWLNWKEMVFFGIANAYKPRNPPSNPSCGTCLSVNPPSATADKKFVVIVAGKKLPGQSRSSNWDKGNLSNYLEGANANGATPFAQSPASSTFNDTVVFQ